MNAVTRVVLADDHPVYRQGLTVILSGLADIALVGVAPDGVEALALIEELVPDVALLDLHMPAMGGIAVTRLLTERYPQVAVLVLTMDEDDESVLAAVRAGARGYLVKGASGERIVAAIRAVAAGEVVFGAAVGRHVLGSVTGGAGKGATALPRSFPTLTGRELQVLDLIAAGRSNPDIARSLFLSEKTIRNHVSSIFTKIDVPNRSAAIVKAREAGLGRDVGQS
jgi:DNA-binding NarL/FixJ family response regulator